MFYKCWGDIYLAVGLSVKKSITLDPRVQASLRRLDGMGLVYKVVELDEDRVTIIIDAESIIRYIVRAVDARVSYPNKKVTYDHEYQVVKIYLWRGEQR